MNIFWKTCWVIMSRAWVKLSVFSRFLGVFVITVIMEQQEMVYWFRAVFISRVIFRVRVGFLWWFMVRRLKRQMMELFRLIKVMSFRQAMLKLQYMIRVCWVRFFFLFIWILQIMKMVSFITKSIRFRIGSVKKVFRKRLIRDGLWSWSWSWSWVEEDSSLFTFFYMTQSMVEVKRLYSMLKGYRQK